MPVYIENYRKKYRNFFLHSYFKDARDFELGKDFTCLCCKPTFQILQKKALELYKLAAAKGERHSCMKLADLYIEGAMVERNEEIAIRYFDLI